MILKNIKKKMRRRLNLDKNYIYMDKKLEEREGLLDLFDFFPTNLGKIKTCLFSSKVK